MKIYIYKQLNPYGVITDLIDENSIPENWTKIVPSNSLIKPVFNSNTENWEEYDETAELKKLAMQQATDITNLKQLAMQQATELSELKKGSAD